MSYQGIFNWFFSSANANANNQSTTETPIEESAIVACTTDKTVNAIDEYATATASTTINENRDEIENENERIINCINQRFLEMFKIKATGLSATHPYNKDQSQRRVDEFKHQLELCNGIISGSFIVQCILGETWDNSDLDIFIPEGPSRLRLAKWLELEYIEESITCQKYIPLMKSTLSNKGIYAFADATETNAYSRLIGPKITEITEFALPSGTKIQFTYRACGSDLFEKSVMNFDFRFIQNSFNIKDGKDILLISNLADIKNRQIVYGGKSNLKCKASRLRINKYLDRGFKIEENTAKLFQIPDAITADL